MLINRPKSQQPIPDRAKKVFTGILFDVYQWEQELFDGTKTLFEKIKRPDTVVIFPILDDGKIILTKQTQPGREPFLGTIGGRVDKDEGVLEAAKRELLEESGYEASDFVLLSAQHPTSKIDWVVYTFIAKNLKKVAEMNLDAGEKINLKLVDFDEFIELTLNKKFVEKEILSKFYEAKLDPKKMKELNKLFDPKF
ncbi:MAG: NUDIX hydrolase [Patescibacteria group bacterium]